jgi:hypothetical protein
MYARPRLLLLAALSANFTTIAHAQHPLILQRLTAWNAAAPQPNPPRAGHEGRNGRAEALGGLRSD